MKRIWEEMEAERELEGWRVEEEGATRGERDRIEARCLGLMNIQMGKDRKYRRKVGSEGTNSARRATGKGGKEWESQRKTEQARVRKATSAVHQGVAPLRLRRLEAASRR